MDKHKRPNVVESAPSGKFAEEAQCRKKSTWEGPKKHLIPGIFTVVCRHQVCTTNWPCIFLYNN